MGLGVDGDAGFISMRLLYGARVLRCSMSLGKLLVSGPDGAYRSGDSILIRDGGVFLGTVEPPELSRDGSSVHFGRFSPSPALRESGERQFAPLMLVEVIAFIADHFSNIETIRFTLTRQVEMHGNGLQVAMARLSLLERIGAANLHMRPRPDSDTPGNFVVQGMWEYTAPNLAALAAELDRQRSAYFAARDASGLGRLQQAGRWLQRAWGRKGA